MEFVLFLMGLALLGLLLGKKPGACKDDCDCDNQPDTDVDAK